MKDWKIGVRMAAGFAVVITISILLGTFAINRMAEISTKTDALSSNYFPSVLALSNLQANLEHSVVSLLRLVASSDQQEIVRLDAEITALGAANEKDIQFYETTPFTPEEAALYADAKTTRAQYLALFAQVRTVGQSTNAKEIARAQQIFDQQLTPVLEKYESEIQTLIDRNKAGANQGMVSIQQTISSAIRGTIIGIILSVAFAIPIAFYIVRGITRPLGQAVATLGLVAGGDLTVTLDVHSGDEVGQMAAALNTTVEKLRSTLQEVAESAKNSNAASRELAAAAEQLASGAQQQAASLEQTSASMEESSASMEETSASMEETSASLEESSASLEEITASTRQTADNAKQASQLASRSTESAESGQGVVVAAIAAMAEINVASAKISDILSTINEIAFQTNLLAVNAAVEAARAGEEGRGFAVVATEVRSLAQRSAEAAKEIKGLIQDSLQKVEKGSQLVNKSGETLQGIVSSVKRVTDIVSEIALASAQQSASVNQVSTGVAQVSISMGQVSTSLAQVSSGMAQVNEAMTQMDQVTQSNSAQTEELSGTAQALSGQAAHLLELVSTFTLGNSREASGGERSYQPLAKSPPHSTVSARRAGNPATRTAPGKTASSAASRRKQVNPAAALVGTPAAKSEDASFEEF